MKLLEVKGASILVPHSLWLDKESAA